MIYPLQNPDLMYDAGSPSSIRNDNLRKVFYTGVTARISIREQAGSRARELHDTAACKVQGVSKRYHECAGVYCNLSVRVTCF